jgi:small-conductance mechanosensitive channel
VRASILVVALLAGAASSPVFAGDDDSAATPTREALSARADGPRPTAAVVVFNRRIVRFRVPVLGMPVEQRAQNASERIRSLLRAPGEHKVTSERVAQGVLVKIDGHIAFAITHDDAEGLGEVAEDAMVADAVRQLDRVVAEMSEARDPRALLVAAGWAAGATAIWAAALWLLLRLIRGAARRLVRYADAKGAEMRAAGVEIVQRERVIEAIRIGLRIVFWVLAMLFTYEWLGYVLSRFPYTRPWGESFASFLVDTLSDMLSAVAESLPGLLVAIIIFLLAHFANSMLRSFFDGVQAGRVRFTWLDADSVRPTRRLVTIAVWLFAVAMAYPYIPGAETDAFRGLSVLLGLMVSVGASGIIGQAASGLILMYTRTFRPGEYVRVGDNEGTVVALGMFTTRVRTGMGEELTLPNSMVLGTVTKNYSRATHGQGFIVDATATIGYDTPWRQVHAMLIEAAKRTPGVLAEPGPRVFQTALSDFYVDYRLVCQAIPTEPRPRAVVLSALHENIQDVFNENGVQIMSPHYLGDPAAPKVVPKAQWYTPPAKPPG